MLRTLCAVVLAACATARVPPPTRSVSAPPTVPGELRGFVSVPLDWEHPADGEIRVFYRLLGADASKPILVFFNGGPGLPSSSYVGLDHSTNALAPYESSFRILLIDQRGTGFSAPLDVDSPRFEPQTVVRLFGSGPQARDAAAVIERVIPPGEPFFLFAHSYGGQVAFQYLARERQRRPKGVILAAPAMPYFEPARLFLGRRMSQHRLNEAVLDSRPDLQAKVLRLKERLATEHYVDADGTPLVPQLVSAYFRYLSLAPQVPQQTDKWLDRMLQAPIVDVNKDLRAKMANPYNVLQQVLVVTDLFGDSIGHLISLTDQTLPPFAPWMFDEAESFGTTASYRGGKYRSLYAMLPSLASLRSVPPLDAVKEALHEVPALFVAAEDDAQLAFDTERTQFELIGDPVKSRFVAVPAGGHAVAFSNEEATVIKEWIANLR